MWIALSASVIALLPCGTAGAADPRTHAFETGLGPAVHVIGSPASHWTLQERMDHWKVPGLSIAVIRGGKLAWAKGYGFRTAGTHDAVDTQTMFSIGSLSKVGTAFVALRLVAEKRLELDRDIAAYTRRWQVPASGFNIAKSVTLRGLMSHTAGMSVDGFADFRPGEPLPSIVDTLEGRAPTKEGAVELIYVPGSRAKYSGGGTTVEQLVIEDVTGRPFAAVAQDYLLDPLRMTRSSYVNPLPTRFEDFAMGHDGEGRPRAYGLEAMPQNAASGLWTTPSDYAQLMIELLRSYRGDPGALLPKAIARDMMVEVAGSRAGLGPFLSGRGATRRFYHSGANDSFRAWMELNLVSGNGVVIFTNSPNGTRLRPEVVRSVAAAEGWNTIDTLDVPDVVLSAQELAQLAGNYEVVDDGSVMSHRAQTEASPIAFRIVSDGHELTFWTGPDRAPQRLIPADPMHFIVERTGERSMEFIRGYGGGVDRVLYRDGDYAIEAKRARPDPDGIQGTPSWQR